MDYKKMSILDLMNLLKKMQDERTDYISFKTLET